MVMKGDSDHNSNEDDASHKNTFVGATFFLITKYKAALMERPERRTASTRL